MGPARDRRHEGPDGSDRPDRPLGLLDRLEAMHAGRAAQRRKGKAKPPLDLDRVW